MKHHLRTAHICNAKLKLRLLALALPLAVGAQAQEALPPAGAPPPNATADQVSLPASEEVGNGAGERKDEVMKMNPFLVTQQQSEGYYTENTLAGTRLNTNIGDLAASITVVTRQQMLDTASLNMNDVFMYEANTEGTESNYTLFSTVSGTVLDSTQADPQTANRIRGIGAADRSHNFFESIADIPFDIYNTESVEIERGPDSLLYGLGSAAGVVNQTSTSANLTKQSGELESRYGTDGAWRASLRWNQPVASGKFAVFVAALDDHQGFERQPAYDNQYREYVAMTWTPTPKTTIRANFEKYQEEQLAPNSTTPLDGVTPWRQAGSPTWNPLTYTLTVNGVATTYTNNAILSTQPGITTGNTILPTMYEEHGQIVLWEQSELSATNPVTGPFTGLLPELAASSTPILKNEGTTQPLFEVTGITNKNIYNWDSINYLSGGSNSLEANIYNVELDQQITPSLFVEAGWYREDFKKWAHPYSKNGIIQIDPNSFLLDGTVNPFYGEPYFMGGGNQIPAQTVERNDNFRLNLAYVADFTNYDGWRKWLGLNRFFAFGETHFVGTTKFQMTDTNVTPEPFTNPQAIAVGSPGVDNVGAVLEQRFYLGTSNGNIAYGPGPAVYGPTATSLRLATPNGNGTYTWVNYPAMLEEELIVNTSRSLQQDDSFTVGWQGSLLNDMIVPTVGARRDRNVTLGNISLPVDSATGLYNVALLSDFNPPIDTYGWTTTEGVVVKPLKWISFSYDQSATFTPEPYGVDVFGNPLPLPHGQGKDMGVHFNLMNNKLVLGLNYYTDNQQHSRGSPYATITNISVFESSFISWANGVAEEELGPGASTSAIANQTAQITGLPAGYVPPTPAQVGSTTTVTSHGVEAQAIWNPVPNWNMKATVGLQTTHYFEIAPEATTYLAARLPTWETAVDPTTGISFWNATNVVTITSPSHYYLVDIYAPEILGQELQGQQTQGQRPWSASGIMTYRFVSGPLKHWLIGGGVRLQAPAIIGYLGDPPNSAGIITQLNPHAPVHDDPWPAFDAWIGRSFPLPEFFGRDITAKVQLNVKDLTQSGNWLMPIAINPDGTPFAYRIVEPRKWYLDVTFDY